MANEVICKLEGGRLRQVWASGAARGKLIEAIDELNAGQTELAELYALKEGYTEGAFGFEQRGNDIMLVRLAEDDKASVAPA